MLNVLVELFYASHPDGLVFEVIAVHEHPLHDQRQVSREMHHFIDWQSVADGLQYGFGGFVDGVAVVPAELVLDVV